jgi:hypothetical protein
MLHSKPVTGQEVVLYRKIERRNHRVEEMM